MCEDHNAKLSIFFGDQANPKGKHNQIFWEETICSLVTICYKIQCNISQLPRIHIFENITWNIRNQKS